MRTFGRRAIDAVRANASRLVPALAATAGLAFMLRGARQLGTPAEPASLPAPSGSGQAEGDAAAKRLRDVWASPSGWRALTDVNNSVVGRWYFGATCAFFLFAGVLALLMRAQLAVPGNSLLTPDLYNQTMTLHGSVMMFLVAVPLFEAVAILLMPQMIAARDLPFPRLSAFGFWCFVIGGVFVCGSIFFGAAPSGGWFMYPPLTTDTRQSGIGADIWLLGLSFIEVAAIAAAVELIVGVLKCRAPGMRLNIMPLYVWYVLVVGVMIVFAFPPLIAGDLLFELERLAGWPFFDARRGGDPVLWQHLFWIFGHPEVYIVFLPSIALVAMIVPTFAGVPIFGYSFIVLAAVGTGFLSFGLWAHHMYATGLPAISLGVFSAASLAVAIPTGVQLFCFVATLFLGRARMSAAMLFVVGGLSIFVVGGLTGVMVALAPFDLQAHDTYFVVAHLHYVLIGGMLFPVLAGVHYYVPLVFDRMLSERWGKLSFWLLFIGMHVTFLPMHLTGLRGMPRRVVTYPEGIGLDTLNLVSSAGAAIIALGVVVFVLNVMRMLVTEQPVAPRNPWNAGTVEWLHEAPGEDWGVRSVPIVESRYPLWDDPDFMRRYDEGRFLLADAPEMKRETLVTSVLDARPLQCLRVMGPSVLPILTAVCLSAVFIFPVFNLYSAAVLSALVTLAVTLVWLWTGTSIVPEKPSKDVGHGIVLPIYVSGPKSVGWWAMFITMAASAAAFASLVFAYFYFWTVHPTWPPPEAPLPGLGWPALAGAAVAASWLLTGAARAANGAGPGLRPPLLLLVAAVLSALAVPGLFFGPLGDGLDPTRHAYPATVFVLLVWAAAQLAGGTIAQLYCLARHLAGRLTAEYDIDIRNTLLYWHFAGAMALIALALVTLFPRLT